MNKIKYILSLISLTCVFSIYANNKVITAYLFDSQTKEPLPFVNINVEGKNKTSVSGIDGKFVLEMSGITASDNIVFSCIGYENLRLKISDLKNNSKLYLNPSIVVLKTVEVFPKKLCAEDIVWLVSKNYKKNYPKQSVQQKIYFHKYEKVPFPKTNQIVLKSSDFVGLEQDNFDRLVQKLPDEFIDNQDAVIDFYNHKGEYKLVPIKGISLEQESNKDLFGQFEKQLTDLFNDIEKTNLEKDVYYKIQSGILGHKFKKKPIGESVWGEYQNDKLHSPVEVEELKRNILLMLNDYGDIESKNWEFINKSQKYIYKIDEITNFNTEPVYVISFKPEKNGLFEGKMYVSTISYAVLQLDFAFAKGKQSERFNAFGFGHSMKFKKAHVVFEKSNSGYFVKYISAQQHEAAFIDRKITISKKQKRFLQDKELNEITLDAKLSFNIKSDFELLVTDRKEITAQQFENGAEPKIMKFKIEYGSNPELISSRTVLAPYSELAKYKAK